MNEISYRGSVKKKRFFRFPFWKIPSIRWRFIEKYATRVQLNPTDSWLFFKWSYDTIGMRYQSIKMSVKIVSSIERKLFEKEKNRSGMFVRVFLFLFFFVRDIYKFCKTLQIRVVNLLTFSQFSLSIYFILFYQRKFCIVILSKLLNWFNWIHCSENFYCIFNTWKPETTFDKEYCKEYCFLFY